MVKNCKLTHAPVTPLPKDIQKLLVELEELDDRILKQQDEIRKKREENQKLELEEYERVAAMPIPKNFEEFKEDLVKHWDGDTDFDDVWLNDKLSEDLIQKFWILFQKRPWEIDEWYFLTDSYIFNIDFAIDEATLRESIYFHFEGPLDIEFLSHNDKATNAYALWQMYNRMLAFEQISIDFGIPLFDDSDFTLEEREQYNKRLWEHVEELKKANNNSSSIDSGLENNNRKSRYIPRDVQDRVWRRDQGKCVECGSKENLEFDHIIPHSKGGANTYRNIQLLCEKCNRSKSDNIG